MAEQFTRVRIGGFDLPINPTSIKIKFAKRIISHDIPGADGDIIQELGRKARTVSWTGVLINGADLKNANLLKEFEKTEVLDLSLPLVVNKEGIKGLKVIITDLEVSDESGRNDWRDYTINCIEVKTADINKNLVFSVNQANLDRMKAVLRAQGRIQ